MAKGLRWLLIDDDADDQELFGLAVNSVSDSIDCLFANDGADGLKLLERMGQELPHAIFLDLNMPRMGGKECLKEIKSNPLLNKIPVIIISTSSDPNGIAECKALGAQDYLVKPPKVTELTKMLSKIFNSMKS